MAIKTIEELTTLEFCRLLLRELSHRHSDGGHSSRSRGSRYLFGIILFCIPHPKYIQNWDHLNRKGWETEFERRVRPSAQLTFLDDPEPIIAKSVQNLRWYDLARLLLLQLDLWYQRDREAKGLSQVEHRLVKAARTLMPLPRKYPHFTGEELADEIDRRLENQCYDVDFKHRLSTMAIWVAS